MAGIAINWDPGAKRRRREESAKSILEELIDADLGLTGDDANKIIQRYMETGDLRLPTVRKTGRTTLQGPGAGLEGPANQVPETEPFVLKKRAKKKGYGLYDKAKGTVDYLDVPEGYDEFEFYGFDSTLPTKAQNTGRSGSASTPQAKAALKVLADYQAALKATDKDGNPKTVSPELAESAKSAAEYLELDWDEAEELMVEEPGWLARKFGKDATVTAVKQLPTLDFKGNRATPKPGQKILTKDQARKLLKAAGGDWLKATEIAKQQGYRFDILK